MSKRNISAQDKINAVKRYLNGLTSQRILANEFSISQASIQQWITNYESMGEDAFLMVNAPKQGVVISSPMCVKLSENKFSGGTHERRKNNHMGRADPCLPE